MPFTPFHFGPGLAIKSITRNNFSFLLFAFSQIIIDLESGYFLFIDEWPVHRFLHTYLGATAVLLVVLVFGKPICEMGLKFWKNIVGSSNYFYVGITWKAAIISASIGVYSHVFLDSIMHSDIRPFSPFSEVNGLLNITTLSQLHLFCIYSGLFGIIIIVTTNLLRDKKPGQSNNT